MQMKIMICDDDASIQKRIRQLLKRAYADNGLDWEEPDCALNAEALLAAGRSKAYDLLYLDIEMSGASGLDAAAEIRARDWQIQIIFVTSHRDYVFDAFRVTPLDFLVKPIDCQRFDETFSRALDNYRRRHQTVTFQLADGLACLKVADIRYISGEGKTVRLLLRGGQSIVVRQRLSELADQLALYHIVRCHRSYLVNLAYVQAITNRQTFKLHQRSEGKEVQLTGASELVHLPIGEKYQDSFTEALMRYQQGGGELYS